MTPAELLTAKRSRTGRINNSAKIAEGKVTRARVAKVVEAGAAAPMRLRDIALGSRMSDSQAHHHLEVLIAERKVVKRYVRYQWAPQQPSA